MRCSPWKLTTKLTVVVLGSLTFVLLPVTASAVAGRVGEGGEQIRGQVTHMLASRPAQHVFGASAKVEPLIIGHAGHRRIGGIRQLPIVLDDKARMAVVWSVALVVAALIVGLIVAIAIARRTAASLRELRQNAEHTEQRLQNAHKQTLRLASEQDALRTGLRESFAKLSRRTRSLLDQQRRLFLELGAGAQTQEHQEWLFKLGHVATRMRRNNENLQVLAGEELDSRFSGTPDLADVIHAAVAEIERYERVSVEQPPAVRISGTVAGDLVRVLAELLDNATNFSPSDSPVVLLSYPVGDSTIIVNVLDEGSGMPASELAAANQRIASPNPDALAYSQGIGLMVVGQLAQRHEIAVTLQDNLGPEQGLRATVRIPARHISAKPAKAPKPAETSAPVKRPEVAPAAKPASKINPADSQPANLFVPARDPASAEPPADAPFGWLDEPITPSRRVAAPPQPAAVEAPTQWFRPVTFPTTDPDKPDAPSWPAKAQPATTQEEPQPMANDHDGARIRTPAEVRKELSSTHSGVHFGLNTSGQDETSGSGGWSFEADEAFRQAEAASASTPAEYTAAGLPRRVPRAQLIPGSAPAQTEYASRYARDPDQTRGRMANLQSGVQRGRTGPTDRPAAST